MIEECEITITNETTIQTPTQITTETQTPTQPEQEIITDTKKPLTDETKAAYKLLLIILVIWLIYEYYKPRPSKPPRQIKSKTLESKLKHIPKPETKQPELITSIQQKSKLHFKLPKLNLQIFKLHLPKIKLPKSLKQLKEWFYRF